MSIKSNYSIILVRGNVHLIIVRAKYQAVLIAGHRFGPRSLPPPPPPPSPFSLLSIRVRDVGARVRARTSKRARATCVCGVFRCRNLTTERKKERKWSEPRGQQGLNRSFDQPVGCYRTHLRRPHVVILHANCQCCTYRPPCPLSLPRPYQFTYERMNRERIPYLVVG